MSMHCEENIQPFLLIVTMKKNHRLRKAPVYWRLEPQCDSNRLEYQKNQSGLPWIMIQFQWHSKPF